MEPKILTKQQAEGVLHAFWAGADEIRFTGINEYNRKMLITVMFLIDERIVIFKRAIHQLEKIEEDYMDHHQFKKAYEL